MKYKDIFLDFDDTLYDTHGNAVIALGETFEAFHLERFFPEPQVFFDAYWWANIDLWGRYSRGEITRDYLIVERFRRPLSEGRGLEVTEALCLEINDWFLDCCSSKSGTLEGAHELTAYLKEQGYRLHMTSNGFHEVQYKKLAACGLKECFDTVILSEDAGANKPSPLYFDYALKVSGADKETTLVIGDNLQTDIMGALGVGIDAMLFNRWNVEIDDLPQKPTFIVNSLREVMTIL